MSPNSTAFRSGRWMTASASVLPPWIQWASMPSSGGTLAYEALLDELRGRVRVQATSAVAVDRGRRDRLQELLKGALDREVVLSVREDPAIIGGLIVRIGDRVIDGSTSTRLESLGRRLAAGAPV